MMTPPKSEPRLINLAAYGKKRSFFSKESPDSFDKGLMWGMLNCGDNEGKWRLGSWKGSRPIQIAGCPFNRRLNQLGFSAGGFSRQVVSLGSRSVVVGGCGC
ncbi:MAG: hypothetical protein LBV15_01090, partial [Planctomycetota bacterium]|nr:hypothetical protein [Planctomycetota bacterium]